MQKAISFLMIGAVVMSLLLCSCDATGGTEETSDQNDEIIAAIDKSSPITSGNLITKSKVDEDGNVNISYYDNHDNLVEQYIWHDGNQKSHTVMTYSDTKMLLTKEELTPQGSHNLLTQYQYDSEDNLLQKTINEFENGQLTKSTTYNADEEITGYSLSFYNDTNRISKIERYDADGEMQEYFMYEYDGDGHTSKYSAYTEDGVLKRYTTFAFNDKGWLIEEKYFDGGNKLQEYYIFDYYDSGNQKTSSHYDAEGNLLSEDHFDDVSSVQ